jgi:hypothetical protein
MVGEMPSMHENTMTEIAVVISSCDKFKFLWNAQLSLFDKNWPNCPYEIHMLSESSSLDYKSETLKLNNFNTGIEPRGPGDWSGNLRKILDTLTAPYILYLQEDYALTEPVDQEKLDILIQYAVDNDLDYVRFCTEPGGNGEIIHVVDGVVIQAINPGSAFRTALSVAIWKKSTLLELLGPDGTDIDPWGFEKVGADKYDKFYCVVVPSDQPSCRFTGVSNSTIIRHLGMHGAGQSVYGYVGGLLSSYDIPFPHQ